jgi:hypothetical protein
MNSDILQEILNELLDQKIIQETDGCYEVSHDIIAANINERRITDDNNRIKAARIIYETEKYQGYLNEKQLSFIEPYINNLAFPDQDNERLHEYITICKKRIEDEKKEKEEQSIKEKALLVREKRIFAAIGIVCAIMALIAKREERMGKLKTLLKESELQLANNNFFSANQSIQEIDQILSDYSVRIIDKFKKDSFITKGNILKHILPPHLLTDRIKLTDKYILSSLNNNIIIKLPQNSTTINSKSCFFNKSYEKLSDFGFSSSTDHFWLSERIDSPYYNKNKISIVTIFPDKRHTEVRTIDTVDIPTGDFDSDGNFFYIKDRSIRRYDITKDKRDSIGSLAYKKSNNKTRLSFFLKKNKAPLDQTASDYFQISFGDSSQTCIFNKNNLKQFTLPSTSQIYLDSNRYLFYSYKIKNKWSPLYIFDLNTWCIPQDPIPANSFKLNPETDFSKICAPYRKENKTPQSIFSKDKLKQIEYNSNDRKLVVIDNKNNHYSVNIPPNKNLIAYEVLDSFFVCVCEDITDGSQTVIFRSYWKNKEQRFRIPPAWRFNEFKSRKYMLLGSANILPVPSQNNDRLLSLLILEPYMSQENYLQKWFQNN